MAMDLPAASRASSPSPRSRRGCSRRPATGGARVQRPSGTHRSLRQRFADTGWRHVVALFVLVFALFPVYWVVVTALDRRAASPSRS